MPLVKPPVLNVWADSGDKIQPSDAELLVGWPLSSVPPARQRFNWVLNYLYNAVRYFSRRGISDWDAAETYAIYDVVRGPDFILYVSKSTNINKTPASNPNDWKRLKEYAFFEDYGALGDGTTNDTAAIQAALSSGNKVLMGTPGKTYLIGFTNTKTVNSTSERYSLLLPSGVRIKGNGATFKLANSSNCTMIMNENADAGPDTDLGVDNLILDQNKANQSAPASGSPSALFFNNCSRLFLEHNRVDGAWRFAGRFLTVTQSYFNDLYCTSSKGDGWSFGIDGTGTQHVTHSFIDNIRAEACDATIGGGVQGNPIIYTTQYCEVGKSYGKDCAGGIKIQDTALNSTFDQCIWIGNASGTSNSGVKVQGNGAGLTAKNITINAIIVSSAPGVGLYLYDCQDISIGKYIGTGNRALGVGDATDVQIKSTNTTRISFGLVRSISCKDRAFISDSTGIVSIDRLEVFNCNDDGTPDAAVSTSGNSGLFTINSYSHTDTNGTSNTTRVLSLTGAGIECRIGVVKTNLSNDTSNIRFNCAAGNTLYIQEMKMGTDAQEGLVTLTNGAATTTVANNSIAYFGASLYPIISIVPWNATAAALGNMRTIPVIWSTGTGFDIKMASNAGASDKVYWKVLGWTSQHNNTVAA